MYKEFDKITISSQQFSLSGVHVFTAITKNGYSISNEVCYKEFDETNNCILTYPLSEVKSNVLRENLMLFEPHWVIRSENLFKDIEPIDIIKEYNNLSWKLIKFGYLVIEESDIISLHDVVEFIKEKLISDEDLEKIFLHQKLSNLAREKRDLISKLDEINNEIDNIRRDINDVKESLK